MDELISPETASGEVHGAEFYLGTVGSWSNAEGVEITLDGQSAPMTKKYKMMLMCRPLKRGARVVVMKQSGTYIVLGEVSLPNSWTSISDLSTGASTSTIAAKVNEILAWMRTQGILWTS